MGSVKKLEVLTDEDELRKLSLLVFEEEDKASRSLTFGSREERHKYRQDCRSNHDSILAILESTKTLLDKFKDSDKADIAHDVYMHSLKGVNFALQTVRNYTVRKKILAQLKVHSDELVKELEELVTTDLEKVESLAKDAAEYKQTMIKYLDEHQSGACKRFADKIRREHIDYEDLKKKCQKKLGFKGEFENLTDEEKLEVYDRMIVDSSRGSIIREVLDKAFAAAGAAVLIFILGSMVWVIFSSSMPVETASTDINDLMSAIGGPAIGDIVAGTAAAYAAAEGVELSSVFLTVLGFSTAVGAAILLAAAGRALIGLFFTSGGKKEHINRYQKVLTHMARLDVISTFSSKKKKIGCDIRRCGDSPGHCSQPQSSGELIDISYVLM